MNRRNFLATALFSAICPLPKEEKKPEPLPRQFRRFNYERDSWEKIEPDEVKEGDVIWFFDPAPPEGMNEIIHVSYADKEEMWAHWRIDPKTNEWVEV